MGSYVTIYDFANETFNYLIPVIAAAVAIAGFALYKTVAHLVRKPKRGGPWLRRRTMVMYVGIVAMIVSITVLVVSVAGELIEYLGTRSAYGAELSTVEGQVGELLPIAIESDAGADEEVAPRRGFAVGDVEFVFVESGVRYGYLGDDDGKPPKTGTLVKVGYYDRKGVNVILKLELAEPK